MSTPPEIIADLQARLSLCQELLGVIEREAQALRRADQPSLLSFINSEKTCFPASISPRYLAKAP